MSNKPSDEHEFNKNNESNFDGSSIRIRYEVFFAIIGFLVSAIYSFYSLQFRIEAQERAIVSLCTKINFILTAKQQPYQLDCKDL
jgi:hypothetical protein